MGIKCNNIICKLAEIFYRLTCDRGGYVLKSHYIEVIPMRYIRYCTNLMTAGVFILLNRIIGIFCPVRKNKAVFISDVRGENGGNLKCVYDAMGEDYERATYFKADRRNWSSFGKFCKLVCDMTTAEVVFLEDYFRYTSYYKVREDQKICQLWHGAGAFKKFGYSRAEGNENIRIHKGYRKYTHVITSSEAINSCYAEAFGVTPDKVRATGVPRTDIFFDEKYLKETKARLHEAYPQLEGKKLILFAPTYRGLRADDASYDFSRIPLDEIYEALHEEYVWAFKWHPALYNNIVNGKVRTPDFAKYPDFFLDLSEEREINDILTITDVMITDYSSVIFDYYLTGGRVVYYPYDFDTYYNGRSFYFDYEEYLFGPVAKTPGELIAAIQAPAEDESEIRRKFGEKYMSACDGRATERVIQWVFEKNGSKECR